MSDWIPQVGDIVVLTHDDGKKFGRRILVREREPDDSIEPGFWHIPTGERKNLHDYYRGRELHSDTTDMKLIKKGHAAEDQAKDNLNYWNELVEVRNG